MTGFSVAFLTFFVAVDPIGCLPFFISASEQAGPVRLRRITVLAVATALGVGLFFLLAGSRLLSVLGIQMADFLIAGGLVLLLFSLRDLLSAENARPRLTDSDLGPVPLGVPLMMGPAALTAGMILQGQYGLAVTVTAMALNLLIAGLLLLFSGTFSRLIGITGARLFTKLANLLLAAFGVMMIRKGVLSIIRLD